MNLMLLATSLGAIALALLAAKAFDTLSRPSGSAEPGPEGQQAPPEAATSEAGGGG